MEQSKIYSQTQVQYKNESWRFDVNLPINYFSILRGIIFKIIKKIKNRFVFEPRISISNEITSFGKLVPIINRSYQFGNVNQLYNGYILTGYRNIPAF